MFQFRGSFFHDGKMSNFMTLTETIPNTLTYPCQKQNCSQLMSIRCQSKHCILDDIFSGLNNAGFHDQKRIIIYSNSVYSNALCNHCDIGLYILGWNFHIEAPEFYISCGQSRIVKYYIC